MTSKEVTNTLKDTLKDTLLIVDGFGLIFRAFYALEKQGLMTSKGFPSSAIYGFTRMLLKLIKVHKPKYFIIALDSKEKTFRNDIYPSYKANRQEPPESLKEQIPIILSLIKKLEICTIEMSGYEADDIIGTLCSKFGGREDINIYICTSDKDMLQLVKNNVYVLSPKRGTSEFTYYNKEKVKEKWDVYPEQIVDLLSLMGDTSDNVPGIKGIGPKNASKLLNRFITLDAIYNNLESLEDNNIKTKLSKGQKEAIISKELCTIKTDLDIEEDIKKFKREELNIEGAFSILNEYELYSLLKDSLLKKETLKKEANLPKQTISTQNDKPKASYKAKVIKESIFYKSLESVKDIKALKDELTKSKKLVSIVLETDSDYGMDASIIRLYLCLEGARCYYIRFSYKSLSGAEAGEEEKTEKEEKAREEEKTEKEEKEKYIAIKEILEAKDIKKVGHNLKYQKVVLKSHGISLNGIHFDTMLAWYMLNPEEQDQSISKVGESLLGNYKLEAKSISERSISEGGKGSNVSKVSLEQGFFNFANASKGTNNIEIMDSVGSVVEEAYINLLLYKELKLQIDESLMRELYYEVELGLIDVLGDMEHAGVLIDTKQFTKLSNIYGQRLEELKEAIYKEAGEVFNINSPKKLSVILFEKLKIKPLKKTKSSYSTNTSVLEKLENKHIIAKYLLEYRKLTKVKQNYLEPLPKVINAKTGRIHTTFNQTVTQTGRLSSSNPNIQNIPTKGKIGDNVKQGFIAKENHILLSADYSQIELRILAHYSNDEKLIYAYKKDKDIHTQTAGIIFKKEETEISKKERQIAKTINFSIIYGMGARRLAEALKIEFKKAKEFIEEYFKEYKGIKRFMEEQIERAYKEGYVKSLFNRVRKLPLLRSESKVNKSFGERVAVNTPIQATSADIIKIAMKNIYDEMKSKSLRSKMLIQVHDELVFEVLEDEVLEMEELVRRKMEGVCKLKVPLKVRIGKGRNWYEANS